jgi:hypothetical protein
MAKQASDKVTAAAIVAAEPYRSTSLAPTNMPSTISPRPAEEDRGRTKTKPSETTTDWIPVTKGSRLCANPTRASRSPTKKTTQVTAPATSGNGDQTDDADMTDAQAAGQSNEDQSRNRYNP